MRTHILNKLWFKIVKVVRVRTVAPEQSWDCFRGPDRPRPSGSGLWIRPWKVMNVWIQKSRRVLIRGKTGNTSHLKVAHVETAGIGCMRYAEPRKDAGGRVIRLKGRLRCCLFAFRFVTPSRFHFLFYLNSAKMFIKYLVNVMNYDALDGEWRMCVPAQGSNWSFIREQHITFYRDWSPRPSLWSCGGTQEGERERWQRRGCEQTAVSADGPAVHDPWGTECRGLRNKHMPSRVPA